MSFDFRKNIISAFKTPPWKHGGAALVAALALLVFGLSTCKKPEDIGLSTLPGEDFLYTDYADSATLATFAITEDTLRSDELSRIVLGTIRDTIFGLTNAGYAGQILLSSTPNLISDTTATIVVDSLVLAIAYAGWYGDSAFTPNIHVYRLTENMYTDSAYYSNRVFQYDPADLEYYGQPYTIRPTSTVIVGSDSNSAPQLRLRLKNELGDSILALEGRPELANNDNWKAWFKGIHVVVDPVTGTGGSLLYLNPTSAFTRMTLYYREGTESKSYSFSLSGGARAGLSSHDFSGSSVEQHINNPTVQYDMNYVQSMAGLKTKLSFPYLKHFKDSGSILINKADLVITVIPDSNITNTPVPENLLLLAKNESGTYEFPIDYFERSFGGSYAASAKTYTFNITRTIQHIIDGTTTDNGFTVSVLGSMVSGNRAVIGSGKPGSAAQMKLKLYYTRLY